MKQKIYPVFGTLIPPKITNEAQPQNLAEAITTEHNKSFCKKVMVSNWTTFCTQTIFDDIDCFNHMNSIHSRNSVARFTP